MVAKHSAILALSLATAACGGPDLPGDLGGTLLFVSDRGGKDAIYLRRLPHGADFVLAGMFDFEIAEDAKLCAEATQRNLQRQRPWHPALEPSPTTTATGPKPA